MKRIVQNALALLLALTVILQAPLVLTANAAAPLANDLKQCISSDYFKDDYLKLNISSDNKSITFSGKTAFGQNSYSASILNKSGNVVWGSINSSGYFSGKLSISNLSSGKYNFMMYMGKQGETLYSTINGIPFQIYNGAAFFCSTNTNAQNKYAMTALSCEDPNDYNDYTSLNVTAAQGSELRTKALEITKNAATDYLRIKAIHDWVAKNIYYDWDAYNSGNYGDNSPFAVYTSKRAVCQGYTELSQAFLVSIGIPCIILQGKIIYSYTESWSTIPDINKTNHAWGAAYASGRWVVFDSTWDSGNKYENKSFNYKGIRCYTYFDPNIDAFSVDHRILMLDDEKLATAPGTPSNFKAVSASYNSAKISWTAVSGAAGYIIYRYNAGTGNYESITVTTAASYTDKTLSTGKTYYYKVRAYKSASGITIYGNAAAGVKAKPVPAVPGSFAAVRAGSTSINLSWKAVAGASGYEIYRYSSSTGKWGLIKTTASLSYTNTGLTKNTTYYYSARAYKTVNNIKIYSSFTAVMSAYPY